MRVETRTQTCTTAHPPPFDTRTPPWVEVGRVPSQFSVRRFSFKTPTPESLQRGVDVARRRAGRRSQRTEGQYTVSTRWFDLVYDLDKVIQLRSVCHADEYMEVKRFKSWCENLGWVFSRASFTLLRLQFHQWRYDSLVWPFFNIRLFSALEYLLSNVTGDVQILRAL
jgi:hypothetical protein